ncbi:hypothetical protein BDAP_000425 [Binucleata daphniae]
MKASHVFILLAVIFCFIIVYIIKNLDEIGDYFSSDKKKTTEDEEKKTTTEKETQTSQESKSGDQVSGNETKKKPTENSNTNIVNDSEPKIEVIIEPMTTDDNQESREQVLVKSEKYIAKYKSFLNALQANNISDSRISLNFYKNLIDSFVLAKGEVSYGDNVDYEQLRTKKIDGTKTYNFENETFTSNTETSIKDWFSIIKYIKKIHNDKFVVDADKQKINETMTKDTLEKLIANYNSMVEMFKEQYGLEHRGKTLIFKMFFSAYKTDPKNSDKTYKNENILMAFTKTLMSNYANFAKKLDSMIEKDAPIQNTLYDLFYQLYDKVNYILIKLQLRVFVSHCQLKGIINAETANNSFEKLLDEEIKFMTYFIFYKSLYEERPETYNFKTGKVSMDLYKLKPKTNEDIAKMKK